jgi:hypothetical protein
MEHFNHGRECDTVHASAYAGIIRISSGGKQSVVFQTEVRGYTSNPSTEIISIDLNRR